MSETKSVVSGIVHFNLFEIIAYHINAFIIVLAIIFAIIIIYIVLKKFLCDKKINSKTFSIYNEIMYYKKKRDSDKLSFAIMDYLGFRVPEEEIKFILATSQNAYMFFKFRKNAGIRKIKFEDGKYLLQDKIKLTKLSNIFFILGTILFSFYLSFSFDLFSYIGNRKDFILLSVYVLCISIPMMISSYLSILENNAAERLINYTYEQKKRRIIMDDNEVKDIMFKEVDLIQGVINRMASNSFVIKGWSLTVAGIAYSLNLSFGKVWILGVGITLLCFLFWFLDAFFLRTERKYRALYNDVVSKYNKKKYKEIKWFNLNTKDYEFDPSVGSFKKVMFSKTLLPFYLCLILISVLITVGTIFIGDGSALGGN